MKKAGLLIFIMFLINLVSAYNGYDEFSIQNMFDIIEPSTMILGSIFIISFAILHFVLTKTFKKQKATGGIIAFVMSLLITYGASKASYDFEGFLFDFGVSTDIFYTLVPLIILGGLIYLAVAKKGGLSISLMVLGGFLIFASYFKIVYDRLTFFIIGIIIFEIGLFMKVKDNDIRKNIILVSVIAVILYGVFIVSKSLFSIWGLLLIILIIIAWVIYKNPKKGEKIKSKVKESLGIETKEIPEYKKPREVIKTKALLEKKLRKKT
jgi:peptidoglycan/LPS O-acetylase OafA/YrhL